MQKIFYNGKIITFDEKQTEAEALLVNDENIVFVGKNDEVLELKTDETELINLEGKTVLPSFYDSNAKVFSLIESRLLSQDKKEFVEDLTEIDENYDKFTNYEIYKDEFLKIQNDYISNGITTIFEMGVTNKEFIFWKKISEAGDLKIDVIAYIDMISSKDVMDNNCRSYRKYKNHFRVGGYLIKIDGSLVEQKAFLKKKYKHESNYKGYSYVHDEQLSFLIKNALDEKKQVVAEVNGDEALDQFIRCFEENIKERSEEDRFKPIAKNCNIISQKQLQQMKKIGIFPSFEIDNLYFHAKKFKKIIGILRSKIVQPLADVTKLDIPFLLNSSSMEAQNVFKLILHAVERKHFEGKIFAKKQRILFDKALHSMIKNSAYLAFDDGFKGGLESGYRADFVVLSKTLAEIESGQTENAIHSVYVDGNKVSI